MGAITTQITSLTVVYSTVYSDAAQGKHQSSASLAFVWGIQRWPVNSPHKGPVTQKMVPFADENENNNKTVMAAVMITTISWCKNNYDDNEDGHYDNSFCYSDNGNSNAGSTANNDNTTKNDINTAGNNGTDNDNTIPLLLLLLLLMMMMKSFDGVNNNYKNNEWLCYPCWW